jgi:hypothetical protein
VIFIHFSQIVDERIKRFGFHRQPARGETIEFRHPYKIGCEMFALNHFLAFREQAMRHPHPHTSALSLSLSLTFSLTLSVCLVCHISDAQSVSPPNVLPQSALTVVTEGEVWAPDYVGVADILLAGDKIVAIWPTNASRWATLAAAIGDDVTRISARGMVVVPGIIDPHIHIQGAGGESGAASRTPWGQVDQLIDAGVTSLVGLLGIKMVA